MTKQKSKKILILAFVVVFFGASIFLLLKSSIAGSFFSPVSVVTNILPTKDLRNTEGRTNILLLGVDKRGPGQVQSGILTDTIMLFSIPENGGSVKVISLPRDFWISEYQSKINEIYAVYGVEPLKSTIENVLGLPVHYYSVVGFDGFMEALNKIGGIEIEVENTFDDYRYPIPGRENDTCGIDLEKLREEKIAALGDTSESSDAPEIVFSEYDFPCRFEHIHFDKGLTKMDAETALKYARSRHSDNPLEGSDFARAKRQQKVVLAAKSKIMSSETLLDLGNLVTLYDTYKNYVTTDINVSDAGAFLQILKSGLDLNNIKTAVISTESADNFPGSGLLTFPEDATLYNGKSVVVPKSGNLSEIKAFVQKFVFSE